MNTKVHDALMRDTAKELRAQNLRDAETLLQDIRMNQLPDLKAIWSDLSDGQVEAELDRIAHLHEWLNLS